MPQKKLVTKATDTNADKKSNGVIFDMNDSNEMSYEIYESIIPKN
jgi:hypothetical protein